MNADRICCFLLTTSLTLGGSCAYAQLEGTLFTSPEQRAYLDYLRQDFLARSRERGFDITETEIPEIPVIGGEGQPAAEEMTYTLGGIVSLRDGTQRIWLNGQALSEKELPAGARLVRENGVPALRFSTDSGSRVLLPGQTLQSGAGSVVERFQLQNNSVENEELANTGTGASGTQTPVESIAEVADTTNLVPTVTELPDELNTLPENLSEQDIKELMEAMRGLEDEE